MIRRQFLQALGSVSVGGAWLRTMARRGAAASELGLDGFESGAYDDGNPVTWQVESPGEYIDVQQDAVKNGEYALEMKSGEVNSNHAKLYYHADGYTIRDGDIFSAWLRTDGRAFYRLSTQASGGGPHSIQAGIVTDHDRLKIQTTDENGETIVKHSFGSPARGEWYLFEVELYPSDAELIGRVYDSSQNLLGEETLGTSGETELEYTTLHVPTPFGSQDKGWFDDVMVGGSEESEGGSNAETDEGGPDIEWQQTYGGDQEAWVRPIVEAQDGGYVFAGAITNSEYPMVSDSPNVPWMVKVDESGTPVWQQTYPGDAPRIVHNLIKTGDGGYLIAGRHGYGSGEAATLLIKVDESGSLQWQQVYPRQRSNTPQSVIETSNGGYVFASKIGYWSDETEGALLVRVDGSGEVKWAQTYHRSDADRVRSVVETSDGGYLFGGYTAAGEDEPTDAWLVKINESGEIQWEQTYGGEGRDRIGAVIAANDAGYVFVGRTASIGSGEVDAWLTNIDESGDLKWQQTYNISDFDYGWTVISTSDGGYLIGGTTKSKDGSGEVSSEIFVVKVDGSGELQWQQTYGGNNTSGTYSVLEASEGGYLFTGSKTSEETRNGWLVKLADTGGSAGEPASREKFDPAMHGFGFPNWGGETGCEISTDPDEGCPPDREFTLEHSVISREEVRDFIRTSWQASVPESGVKMLSYIFQAGIERHSFTNGHCYGMVSAASDYYREPSLLPDGIDAASGIPRPTGQFDAVGERIRNYQTSQLVQEGRWVLIQGMVDDQIDSRAVLEVVTNDIDSRAVAPIWLYSPDRGWHHQVLAYSYEEASGGDEIVISVYDPDLSARSYNGEGGSSGSRSQRTITLDAESGEIRDDYFEEQIYETYTVFGPHIDREFADSLVEGPTRLDQLRNSVFFGLASPARLDVDAPEEANLIRVTADHVSNSGTFSDAVFGIGVPPGDYDVAVVGEGDGEYSLTSVAVQNGEVVLDEEVSGTISDGATDRFSATIDTSGDSSIQQLEGRDYPSWLPYVGGGAGVLGVSTLLYRYLKQGEPSDPSTVDDRKKERQADDAGGTPSANQTTEMDSVDRIDSTEDDEGQSEDLVYCIYCGEGNPSASTYCTNCGEQLKQS